MGIQSGLRRIDVEILDGPYGLYLSVQSPYMDRLEERPYSRQEPAGGRRRTAGGAGGGGAAGGHRAAGAGLEIVAILPRRERERFRGTLRAPAGNRLGAESKQAIRSGH